MGQLLFVIKSGRLGDNPEIWKALHRSNEECERPFLAIIYSGIVIKPLRNRSFQRPGVNSNIDCRRDEFTPFFTKGHESPALPRSTPEQIENDDDEKDCSWHRASLKGGRERLRPNRGFPAARGRRVNPHKRTAARCRAQKILV